MSVAVTQPARALLDVECSLLGRRWVARHDDDRLALALAQRLGVPEIIGRVLAGRGVDLAAAAGYLAPRLRETLPDPSRLRDMDRAAERLAAAVEAGEAVGLIGDYDVDGATSTALIARYLSCLGVPVRWHIPDRIDEGYGPGPLGLDRVTADGARLVMTLDCGTTGGETLAEARRRGVDVIVVDHHAPGPELPPAIALVNPKRLDDSSGLDHLSAVGVAFLLVIATNRQLRRCLRPIDRLPDPLGWLDLVALGTVCDVVPLKGVNRALVSQGLKIMRQRRNPGLAALADAAGLDRAPEPYHLGFVLGPRINAGGRVGDSSLGVRLLLSDDASEAAALAARLEDCNGRRREIEDAVLDEALARIARRDALPPVVVVAGEGWHPGVVGIIASRLKERLDRPALVVALNDGEGKASGRSVEGVSLGDAIIAAREAGLVIKGGGHAMAAGCTLDPDRLPALEAFLTERLGPAMAARPRVRPHPVDALIGTRAADPALARLLAAAGPYGAGNPEPTVAIAAARLVHASPVRRGHVRCAFMDEGGTRLGGIAFRAQETPLGRGLLDGIGRPWHVIGTLKLNVWAGRESADLVIEDAAPA